MSYALIENFSAGVDQTRPMHVGTPGTLWEGINGHISRGGDFEKRKAFVEFATVPAQTRGLIVAQGRLNVFGSGANPGLPAGFGYVRMDAPSASPLAQVLSSSLFDGYVYGVGKYDDGSVHHFYNGSRITDWDGGTGNPAIKGTVIHTHKKKVLALAENLLYFSGVNAPAGWTVGSGPEADVGAGFLNMSNHQQGAEALTGVGTYQDKVAVFASNVTQIWFMADDPSGNNPVQVLPETGTRSPRSVRGYADIDLFYLSDTGIRSLRARDVNNVAGVQDVGTPIDNVVTAYIDTLTDAQLAKACAVVDPRDGRFWLAVGSRIFVFSYFPSKKISAWTWYEPGFEVDDMVTLNRRIYVRSGSVVYVYGGVDGQTYDSCRVVAQLPFMTNNKPGHSKIIQGVDVSASGEWRASILVDPSNPTQFVDFGALSGVTWPDENIAGVGMATHIAPRFVSESPGPASLSQVGIHFQTGDSES